MPASRPARRPPSRGQRIWPGSRPFCASVPDGESYPTGLPDSLSYRQAEPHAGGDSLGHLTNTMTCIGIPGITGIFWMNCSEAH